MEATRLITLASARGVDLSRVGGSESNTVGVAGQRQRTAEERQQGRWVVETAKGRTTRTAVAAAWSHAELAMAAADMAERPWYAARYTYLGDHSVYDELFYFLATEVLRLGMQHNWRPMVMSAGKASEPQFYFDRLALLVLDEQQLKRYFVSPVVYAIYMGVNEVTWRRILDARFSMLKSRYEAWLAKALATIQRRLAHHDEATA